MSPTAAETDQRFTSLYPAGAGLYQTAGTRATVELSVVYCGHHRNLWQFFSSSSVIRFLRETASIFTFDRHTLLEVFVFQVLLFSP